LDKITLDSNVWKNHYFINWLQSDQSIHKDHICPIIVYLETKLWYDMRGLRLEDFNRDLQELKSKIILFNETHVEQVIKFTQNSNLPFRHHARDFIIGAIAFENESLLITNNIGHFGYLPKEKLLTPQQYLRQVISENH
jgi:predicted nucleic acid-binding protein